MRTYHHAPERQRGFTLVELMIAMTIFAIGLPAFFEAGAFALKSQNRAEATVLGADLAQAILGRLNVLDLNDAAMRDLASNNAGCYNVGGSCVSDHGNNTVELTRILTNWGATGANGSAFRVQNEDGFAAVWYEGYWYHVAWNVEDNRPYPGMKYIDLYVVQKPFTGALGVASWGRISHFRLTRMISAL